MQGNDREESLQELWKSQEETFMQITIDDVRARSRKYQRESVVVLWAVLILTPLFVGGFIYNLLRFHQPSLIAGTTFALIAVCGIAWKAIQKNPRKPAPAVPCMDFLRQQLDGKRRGALWVRNWLLLLIPAVLLCWWGGGPALGAKTFGLRSPASLRLFQGPAPLLVMIVLIAFEWFAFMREARRAEREIRKLEHG